MKERQVGDVVQLNSGSPPMRVVAIVEGSAFVAWWGRPRGDEPMVRTASFPLACLRPDYLPIGNPPPLPQKPS